MGLVNKDMRRLMAEKVETGSLVGEGGGVDRLKVYRQGGSKERDMLGNSRLKVRSFLFNAT